MLANLKLKSNVDSVLVINITIYSKNTLEETLSKSEEKLRIQKSFKDNGITLDISENKALFRKLLQEYMVRNVDHAVQKLKNDAKNELIYFSSN